MSNAFWKQFSALFWKNWIILLKHPFLNVLRCFLLPVAYGIFLAVAQIFLVKPNNYGLGSPAPIYSLDNEFDGSYPLIWADGTTTQSTLRPEDIIARISQNFSTTQRDAIRRVATPADIPEECPQNFNLFSECFAAIAFNDLDSGSNASHAINYTIRADGGLVYINVIDHTSDYEKRIMPLQWAIDKAIIELTISQDVPTPLELPFTQATNEQQSNDIRTSYIRGIRELLVIALFICFVGIAYQLPGGIANERSSLLTPHMKAMGLSDAARIVSWHLSISLAYLPAWVIVGLTWHYRIWTESSAGLIFIIHVLLGLSIASYSIFVCVPFSSRSPQLAAVASTFLSILLSIVAVVFKSAGNVAAVIYTIIFPPGYYVFITRALAGWEDQLLGAKVVQGDPDNDLLVLPLIIAAIVDIFLWPYLAILLERRLYDAHHPRRSLSWSSRLLPWRRNSGNDIAMPSQISPDTAICIRNVNKTFKPSSVRPSSKHVTAISDLTLNVPRGGIFVLLGSNGSGKSTLMSILAGILAPTTGEVIFCSQDGHHQHGRDIKRDGSVGIVPQKNVLFPELTCLQTLKVWKSIKVGSDNGRGDEDLQQLLKDCDLEMKINENAGLLSGGQKRKLQLAIGLVGGSQILLVDECTSGVDPLSRRALWRTLTSVRDRTIIFTTHFLDEADLLADHISILAAPGNLVAEGSPVRLKRDLGQGYSVVVSFGVSSQDDSETRLLDIIRDFAPDAQMTSSDGGVTYHLSSKDHATVQSVLKIVEERKAALNITSYDLVGTSIESIFLGLMATHDRPDDLEKVPQEESLPSSLSTHVAQETDVATLPQGKKTSPFRQAATIFHKRLLILRRSWLSPLIAVLIAVFGAAIPLVFISDREQTCVRRFRRSFSTPLYLPAYSLQEGFDFDPESQVLESPPGLLRSLPGTVGVLELWELSDNQTFLDTIHSNYRNLSLGGVSFDASLDNVLVAWEASAPGLNGPAFLNLASNILYSSALNTTSTSDTASSVIYANFETFPRVNAQTLTALKWVVFFGAALAVFPAFFALYVSEERKITLVQSMQFSNGLSNPTGLWLGHLAFDTIFTIISMTVIVIIFATASNQFHGLGLLWLVMVLYGISGALFAYCFALATSSPLAAFASAAGYQVIMFLLYVSGYLLTLTYAKTSDASRFIDLIHFTMSILSPVCSLMRAAFVSVNLFSLLCDGSTPVSTTDEAVLRRLGGPLLYLFIYPFFLFAILVWVDSGSVILSRLQFKKRSAEPHQLIHSSNELESKTSSKSHMDLLEVVGITKRFGSRTVVDDVSLGVPQDVTMALLGPNGAGKTTTFNIIRGDVIPESGSVLINGVSVILHPQSARLSLGICPQFTPIDSQLTVKEHLYIYGQLKGLSGKELVRSVEVLLRATGLDIYAERLASHLSGGNQRKVALCAAMIGNPPVILIDEFSTGVDARMRREMWKTLRTVAKGKAVVITTHSMEEASALSNKVAIIAKRVLAVGKPSELTARYPSYEVHFSCRTRDEVVQARELMARIPGARLSDDVATRFEVPLSSEVSQAPEGEMTLARLFSLLSADSQGGLAEYTVEKVGLESVFLRVIKGSQVSEEREKRRRWACW